MGVQSISYVLVNEDRGATFNNIEYNLGAEFVTLVNQDPVNIWHTTSRSIATAGLEQGSFDVMIILPQNFSENLLSLQSFTPEQAQIFYEVRPGQTDLTRAIILENVGIIIQDFNARIIQMYFSSILGNLFDAQHNVRLITQGEHSVQSSLLDNIHNPFTLLPDSFSTVITEAESLSGQKMNWQEQQESFTERVQEQLISSAEDFLAILDEMKDYHALQERIGNINLVNAQNAVNVASETDEAFYRRIFDILNETTTSGLDNFLSDDIDGSQTGTMQELIDERDNVAGIQSDRIDAIVELIALLNAQAKDLRTLRMEIAVMYFDDPDATPDTATDNDIRRALVNLADIPQTTTTNLADAYFAALHDNISKLMFDDLRDMIAVMYYRDMITTSQYNDYQRAFAILERYVDETTGVDFDSSSSFKLIDTVDEEFNAYEDFEDKSANLNLLLTAGSPGNTFILTLDSDDDVLQFDTGLQTRISADLIAALDDVTGITNINVTVTRNNNTTITIGVVFDEDPPPSGPPPMQFSILLPIEFDIRWNLDENWRFNATQQEQVFNEIEYTLYLDSTSIDSGTLSFFVNIHYANLTFLRYDLSPLLDQLQLLDRTVGQIIMIFGPATQAGQTLSGFTTFLNTASFNNNRTIRQLAATNSVYWSHAQLTRATIERMIGDSLLVEYRAQGTQLWNEVMSHYEHIRNVILNEEDYFESLTEILSALPTPNMLIVEVNNLLDWHDEIRKAVAYAHAQWQANYITQLEITSYSSGASEGDTRLFYDTMTGEHLFRSAQFLIENSVRIAETTMYSAAQIQSLEERFTHLTTRTEEVLNNTQSVLDDMDNLLEGFIPQVENNLRYADNFSSVLSNARIGGADNPDVMSFLSNPLNPVRTAPLSETASVIPYQMTVISTLLILLIGFNIRHIDAKRQKRESHKHLTMSRTWHNIPTSIKTLIISSVLGVILGVFSHHVAPGTQMLLWTLYVSLITISGVLLISYFARQAPKLAIYPSLAIFGLYILFTPILGVTAQQSTWIARTLQLSPLKVIENGFVLFIQGGAPSLLLYVTLVALAGLGIWLNLLVRFGKREVIEV